VNPFTVIETAPVPALLPTMATLPAPVTDSEGTGTNVATPRKELDCELAAIDKLEPEPDLFLSVNTLPVADVTTGDLEFELKAVDKFQAIIEEVSYLP